MPLGRRLSVVVVNYKGGENFTLCVASLDRLREREPLDLIVVDNSPADERCPVSAGGMRVIHTENRGYAAACNLGFRHAETPFVLFMNPDASYVSGPMDELLDWFENNETVGLIGPRVANPDGTRQFSCRSFPTLTTALAHSTSFLTRLAPRNALSRQYLMSQLDGKPCQVDWASGCCLLARADAFRRAGGFDEEYFLYFEDVDLALRMKAAGWTTAYFPAVTFEHRIGCSRAHLSDSGIRAKHESAARFFRKHVFRGPVTGALVTGLARFRARLASTFLTGQAPAAVSAPPSHPPSEASRVTARERSAGMSVGDAAK